MPPRKVTGAAAAAEAKAITPMPDGRTRIISVKARNFKQIQEVEIDHVGDIHHIKGDTAQGKTSILDAIEATIRGCNPSMVRRGASKAELELEMDTATITRIISADPAQKDILFAKTADGAAIERAQDFLKQMVGPSAFRPLRWVQLGAEGGEGHTKRLRMQRDQLLESIPMSLSDQDVADAVEALGQLYAEALAEVNFDGVNFDQHPYTVCTRLEESCMKFYSLQNSRAKDAEDILKVTPAPEMAAPKESIEELTDRVNELIRQYHRAEAQQQGQSNLAQQRDAMQATYDAEAMVLPPRTQLEKTATHYLKVKENAQAKIEELKAALAAEEAVLADADKKLTDCDDLDARWDRQEARRADLDRINAELAGGAEVVDLEVLKKQGEKARAQLKAKELQEKHDAAAQAATVARERSETIYRLVEFFRDELPKQLLSLAELPVEGLSFDADKILINGIPLHQLGTSEQYRVGIFIAAALNPRSGFVLIDGAESMGKKDLAAVAEAATERGLQLIMTFVAPDAVPAEGVTVMENGLAKTA